MNDQWQPDSETLACDDLLLDALGRGEPLADHDSLTLAMAIWRDDISTGLDAEPIPAPPSTTALSRRPRVRRVRRFALIAAAVSAALGAGVTVAAASAQPGSPLWPVTEFVYTERAESVTTAAAGQALDEAQTAVDEQRPADAARALNTAESLIGRLRSADVTEELQRRLEQIRAALSGSTAGLIGASPSTAPAGAPQPTLSGSAPPTPQPSTPAPTTSPLLPILPLPSRLLPLPTLLPG